MEKNGDIYITRPGPRLPYSLKAAHQSKRLPPLNYLRREALYREKTKKAGSEPAEAQRGTGESMAKRPDLRYIDKILWGSPPTLHPRPARLRRDIWPTLYYQR